MHFVCDALSVAKHPQEAAGGSFWYSQHTFILIRKQRQGEIL